MLADWLIVLRLCLCLCFCLCQYVLTGHYSDINITISIRRTQRFDSQFTARKKDKPLSAGLGSQFFTIRISQSVGSLYFLFVLFCPSFTANLIKRLENSAGKAAIDAIPRHVMFPSIHDAVISAVRARDHAVCFISKTTTKSKEWYIFVLKGKRRK